MSGDDVLFDNEHYFKILNNFIHHFLQKDFEKDFHEKYGYFESNKIRNWFSGTSKRPVSEGLTKASVSTFASNGSFKTPFFGETFDKDNFLKSCGYVLNLQNPFSDSINRSLVVKIQVNLESQDSCVLISDGNIEETLHGDESFEKEFQNFTEVKIIFTRFFSDLDYDKWSDKRFTGFKLDWFTNGEDPKEAQNYLKDKETENFIALANLVHDTHDNDVLWKKIKEVKYEELQFLLGEWSRPNDLVNESYRNSRIDKFLESLVSKLDNQDTLSTEPSNKNISDADLEVAMNMTVYLYTYQEKNDFWVKWYKYLEDMFQTRHNDNMIRRYVGRTSDFYL